MNFVCAALGLLADCVCLLYVMIKRIANTSFEWYNKLYLLLRTVMDMNLNQLRYFVSVAECGNFTKAAVNHYISQTAITQQIRSLEESIGAKLFDRNSRPVALTPARKVFLKDNLLKLLK